MRRVSVFVFILFVCALIGASCNQKSGTVLVKVGSEVITEPDLEMLARVNPRLKRRLESPDGRQQILNNYVDQALLYQEAKRKGLGRDPAVKEKIKLYNKVILAQSLLESVLEDSVQEYYDAHKDEFEKIRLAHIYIPFKTKTDNPAVDKKAKIRRNQEQSKKKAEEVRAVIEKTPADFDKIALKYSQDPRTKKRGGDLGWLTLADNRLKRWGWSALIDKSFPLAEGTLSVPIKTDNGYHIVKVTSGKKMEDIDQVKTRIRFKLQANVKEKLVTDLKSRYPVSFTEPAPAQSAPAKVAPAAEKKEKG